MMKKQPGVLLQVKRWKMLAVAVLVFCVSILGYLSFGFVLSFQLLGPPVRNNEYGWLGPTPRSSSCAEDIGKVNYWTCGDVSVFAKHRFGCALWLRLNGLKSGQ